MNTAAEYDDKLFFTNQCLLQAEAEINKLEAKLAKSVSGSKNRKPKYAIHIRQDGHVDWCGEITGSQGDMLCVDVIDAVMAHCGFWVLSGEIKREPISEWRFFMDKAAAMEETHKANKKI